MTLMLDVRVGERIAPGSNQQITRGGRPTRHRAHVVNGWVSNVLGELIGPVRGLETPRSERIGGVCT